MNRLHLSVRSTRPRRKARAEPRDIIRAFVRVLESLCHRPGEAAASRKESR